MKEEEKIKYEIERWQDYVRSHILLLNRIAKTTFGTQFLSHDSDKIAEDAPDWYLISFSKRSLSNDGKLELTEEDKKEINRAVGTHVKINPHHPEFWDDSITNENFDFFNPPHVNAEKMPDEYLTELACDWSAVALKNNKPLMEWFDNNVGKRKRYGFSDRQKEIIRGFMSRIAVSVEKYNLHFERTRYTQGNEELKEKLMELISLRFSEDLGCNASSSFSAMAGENVRKTINLGAESEENEEDFIKNSGKI